MVNLSMGARRACAGWLVTAVLALFSSGCVSTASDEPNEEPLASVTSELKNGTTYDGSALFRGAVGLYIWSPVWGSWQTCSGQVVSRRTIMTAAHCVIRGSADNPGGAWVIAWRPSSNSAYVPVLPMTWVTTRYNPSYIDYGATTPFDVGLFISPNNLQNITSGDSGVLAKSTPSNVTMYALGFGYYDDGPLYYDDYGRYGQLVPTYASRALEYFFENTDDDPEICAQDSGGPLKSTTSGLLLVYGLASRHTGSGTYCKPVGHWATTKHNMNWLRGKISGNCLETSTLYSCW